MQLAACGSHTEPDRALCVQQCMVSRVNAGVHFQDAVDVAPVRSKIGDAAYEYVSRLIAGTEPVRPPSKGRPVSDIGWLYDRKPDEMADTGEPFMPRAAGIEVARESRLRRRLMRRRRTLRRPMAPMRPLLTLRSDFCLC